MTPAGSETSPGPVDSQAEPSVTPAEVIVVVGATGTGKSAYSLKLADRLAGRGRHAEIVNADAMQMYRGMDIGTAKLPLEERRGVPHHLFDVLPVTAEATVADYQQRARTAITEILERGNVPILVGGSGLYVSSVIFDFQFPGTDPEVRAALEADLLADGVAALFERLKQQDPGAAERIGEHNARRIVRALEINAITGGPHLAALPDEPVWWRPSHIIGLTAPREILTARLDVRVRSMWAAGILDEVRRLIPAGIENSPTAGRAIGYAQALDQIHGRASEHEAIDSTQQLTRRYARRQVSWFKRYPATRWLDSSDAVPAPIDLPL